MCVLQVYSRLSSTPCNTSRQLRNDKSTERSFAFIFLIDLCPSSVGLVWTFLFLFNCVRRKPSKTRRSVLFFHTHSQIS
ncbi:unnamed protein product [Tenebrio molitor]|nr:unnamed protein product [Tenebrio molitor]